jgi:hypothetical protein
MAGPSIISMPPGMMPAAMMSATASPAALAGRRSRQQRPRRLRLRQDAHGHLDDHAQQPFGACHQGQQIEAGASRCLPPRRMTSPSIVTIFDPEQIIGGQPVLQAVHAAGVLRHVAADGAGDLAGRIGCVIEAVALHRLGDGEVGDARLHPRAAVVDVDFEDLVEFAEAEQDPVRQGQRPARQRGACAARHHFQLVALAVAHHLRQLLYRLREHDDQRQRAIGSQSVGFVGAQLVLVGDHPFARDDPAQIVRDLGAPRQNVGVRRRHLHGIAPPSSPTASERETRARRALWQAPRRPPQSGNTNCRLDPPLKNEARRGEASPRASSVNWAIGAVKRETGRRLIGCGRFQLGDPARRVAARADAARQPWRAFMRLFLELMT